jgi:hypothetical protein
MAKKPEPPKPVRWGIYKLAAKQTWVGEVEAPDEAAKLLKDFDPQRDDFTIDPTHNEELGGKSFKELDDENRQRILDYQFSVH